MEKDFGWALAEAAANAAGEEKPNDRHEVVVDGRKLRLSDRHVHAS